MKQKLLLGIGTALLGLSGALAAESVPYSSPIGEVVGGVGQFCSGWTMVNANGDSKVWDIGTAGDYAGVPSILYNETLDMDDWMISPAITLQAGVTYTVSVDYATQTYTERFRIVASTSNTVVPVTGSYSKLENETQLTFKEVTDVQNYLTEECSFTPTASGDYYFGIQGCSQKDNYELCIKNFSITGGDGGDDPEPEPFSFSENFSSNFSAWTVINVHGDATWEAKSSSFGTYKNYAQISYNTDTTTPKDDWLISPALALEAGKKYKITYNHKAQGDEELLTVYLAPSMVPDEIKATTPINDHLCTGSAWNAAEGFATISETGNYHLSFYAHSDPNKYLLSVTNILLEEVEEIVVEPVVPNPVNNFVVKRNDYRDVIANLSWYLPTQSTTGKPLTDENAIQNIKIYRDGATEPVVTLPGEATRWTDNAESGLTAGIHTYEVEVIAADNASEKVSKTSNFIGLGDALTEFPANFIFQSAKDDCDRDWATVCYRTNSSSFTPWYFTEGSKKGIYWNAYGFEQNDWLITRPVTITEPGTYSVLVAANVPSGDESKVSGMEVNWGTSVSNLINANGSVKLVDNIDMSSQTSTASPVQSKYLVTVTEPGDYYVGIHAHGDGTTTPTYFYVQWITVDKAPTPVDPDPVEAPTTLEDLTVWASDDNSITSPRVIFESGLGYEIQVSHAYTEGSFSVSFVNDESESHVIGNLDLSTNPAVLQITAMDPAEAASFAAIPDGFTQVPSGTWRIKLTGSEKPVISKLAIVRNATGVELLEADGLRICGNAISLARAARVQVFAIDGKVLLDKVTDAVELSNLPAGVLLVKVGNRTVKITR